MKENFSIGLSVREQTIRRNCLTYMSDNDYKDVRKSQAELIVANTKQLQVDTLDELLKDPVSGNYHSDVWLLTNEERLAQFDSVELAELLKERWNSRSHSSPDVEDDVAFQMILSRRCDSISEKLAYYDWLSQQRGEKNEELQNFLEEQKSLLEDNKSDTVSVDDHKENV